MRKIFQHPVSRSGTAAIKDRTPGKLDRISLDASTPCIWTCPCKEVELPACSLSYPSAPMPPRLLLPSSNFGCFTSQQGRAYLPLLLPETSVNEADGTPATILHQPAWRYGPRLHRPDRSGSGRDPLSLDWIARYRLPQTPRESHECQMYVWR